MQFTSMKTLTWTNHEDWIECLKLNLALRNVDEALYNDEPNAPTDTSSVIERTEYDKWQDSNRLCLLFMKCYMETSIIQSIPDLESLNAKRFLEAVNEKFIKFDKVERGRYFSLLEKTKYDGVGGVRMHIIKLMCYFNKLKSMKVDLGETYLIWRVLESLPSQFDVLRTVYNAQKEEWSINELISIATYVEENGKALSEQPVAVSSSEKKKFNYGNKGYKGKQPVEKKKNEKFGPHKASCSTFKGNCRLCQKYGHKQSDCKKFKV